MTRAAKLILGCLLVIVTTVSGVSANPDQWKFEWSNADFAKHSVDYGEIL